MTTMCSFVRKIRSVAKHTVKMYKLKRLVKQRPCKIVVGASGVFDAGWIPTEIDMLNLLNPHDWNRLFDPNSIDAILAEDVWEHLTEEEGIVAARMCFKYLRPGGYMRVAVPDGLHPDRSYIEWVRVGGTGLGADDHKILYTYNTLKKAFETAGFEVVLYEYFDEQGMFHYNEWNPNDGKIHRSKRFDIRNKGGDIKYTSIIVDARKEHAT